MCRPLEHCDMFGQSSLYSLSSQSSLAAHVGASYSTHTVAFVLFVFFLSVFVIIVFAFALFYLFLSVFVIIVFAVTNICIHCLPSILLRVDKGCASCALHTYIRFICILCILCICFLCICILCICICTSIFICIFFMWVAPAARVTLLSQSTPNPSLNQSCCLQLPPGTRDRCSNCSSSLSL